MKRFNFFIKSFFSFILFPSLAFSWNISLKSFSQKIEKQTPSWIEEGIDRDMSYFQNGFSSSEITLCLEKLNTMPGIELAGLVRIHFINGQLNFEPLKSLSSEQSQSLEGFLSALYLLNSIWPLPPLDFILTLNPSFDRPFLLNETFVPIFAVSKEKHNHKVLLVPRLWNPEREMLLTSLSYSSCYDWNSKIEKALWRGSATDGRYGFYNWDCLPRARLAFHSCHHGDSLDARLISTKILDYSLTQEIEKFNLFAPFLFPQEQSAYKYLISIDGKASPSSFEWQLFSHSLVFKNDSNRIEWFYEALKPQEHFISFNMIPNDLIDKISWARTHDSEAKSMAEKAYHFAESHLLDEEAFVYLYKLLIAYAELLNIKNENRKNF